MQITPNRVASALGSVAGLATAAYGLVGSLPEKWQGPALIGVGLLAHTGVVVKYLDGCQNWDRVLADTGQLTKDPQKIDTAVTDVEKLLQALEAESAGAQPQQ